MGILRRNFLISASLIGIIAGTAGAAQAGGFAVREQSAY